jgi:hypothetical protein
MGGAWWPTRSKAEPETETPFRSRWTLLLHDGWSGAILVVAPLGLDTVVSLGAILIFLLGRLPRYQLHV